MQCTDSIIEFLDLKLFCGFWKIKFLTLSCCCALGWMKNGWKLLIFQPSEDTMPSAPMPKVPMKPGAASSTLGRCSRLFGQEKWAEKGKNSFTTNGIFGSSDMCSYPQIKNTLFFSRSSININHFLLSDVFKKKGLMKERFMCEVFCWYPLYRLKLLNSESVLGIYFPWKMSGSEMPEKPSKSEAEMAGSSASLLPDLASVSKGGNVGVPKRIESQWHADTYFVFLLCFFQCFAGCFWNQRIQV